MSIIEFIKKFNKNKRILFTTPSHSQGDFIVPKIKDMLGKKFYSCDYSEIEGFDNLSNPVGIIKSAQKKAAEIYDAKSTFFLTNGSTSGIIAAMMSVLNKNDKVIIARNCHKSVYNALVLTGAIPIWLLPKYNSNWGIFESLDLFQLESLLNNNKDVKAVVITNPTYEGVMFDITSISDICKKYNVYLIVDEAHGALWNFYKSLGTPAIMQGADISVQSLHKTLGALNPSALLHVSKNSSINPNIVQQALNIITTTSPSYPLLLNIEGTIEFLNSKKGQKHIKSYIRNINKTLQKLKKITNLEIYYKNNDMTKILIKVKGMSGFEVSDVMMKKYGIEDELSNSQSVLYLTGIGTSKSKLKKLETALRKFCKNDIKTSDIKADYDLICTLEPRIRYTPSVLFGKNYIETDVKHSISRVSMELITDYPPGIPIILPGEIIRKEHVNYLLNKRKSIKVLQK